MFYFANCYNWDWVAWNGAMVHIGRDLEGIGYGMLQVVFRYFSGGNGEDHETLRIANYPAEIRPLRSMDLRQISLTSEITR